MRRSKIASAVLTLAVTASLAGCGIQAGPSPFQVQCEKEGGRFQEDRVSEYISTYMTGTITGTVTVNGQSTIGSGTGSGIYTGFVELTVRTCVRSGEIVDLEIL